jgi:hypothetical protein
MTSDDVIDLWKVATRISTHKDENPLPFLSKSSSKSGSGTAFQQTRKRQAPRGDLMDKSYERRLILPLGSFLSQLHFI